VINIESINPYASGRVLADTAIGASVRGVYAVLFDSDEGVLEKSGYLEFDKSPPIRVHGYDLMYIGASLDPLRRRVLAHLTGNTKGSTLRMTVGMILSTDLNLEPIGNRRHAYYDFGEGEYRLTEWLLTHTRVAFIESDDPFGLEWSILQQVPLPLNISHRKRHGFSKYLLAMRAYYAARPRPGNSIPA
jgi:hypothetical protein